MRRFGNRRRIHFFRRTAPNNSGSRTTLEGCRSFNFRPNSTLSNGCRISESWCRQPRSFTWLTVRQRIGSSLRANSLHPSRMLRPRKESPMTTSVCYKIYGQDFHIEPKSVQFANCVFHDDYRINNLRPHNVRTILDVGSHVGSFTVMARY